jgi:hypothetical protein
MRPSRVRVSAAVVLLMYTRAPLFCSLTTNYDAHVPFDSCHEGVSLKTQELYLIVFVTRYLDLLYSFISP